MPFLLKGSLRCISLNQCKESGYGSVFCWELQLRINSNDQNEDGHYTQGIYLE